MNSTGSSNFNSMQLSVDKRFSKGMTLQANYTWGKSIDYGSGGGTQWPSFTPDAPWYDRGLSDFHHEHRFVTSGLWELPALTGKPPVVKWVLGGWQTSGAMILQSAAAFSVQAGRDNSLTGFGNRAQQVGDPSQSARQDPNRDPVLEWFNTRAFAHNAPGTYGNSGRNIVFGPGLANVDFAVAKYFPITERVRLQFRGEFFNLFNHTNFNEPNSTITAATYGRITSALDPRILQFGLKAAVLISDMKQRLFVCLFLAGDLSRRRSRSCGAARRIPVAERSVAEPGGKVLARSIGRNPVWEKDHDGSPAVEDRVQWRIRYRSAGGVQRELSIEGNPWGAYRIEEGGQTTADLGITRSAQVTSEGWSFEAALPLKALDVDWNSGDRRMAGGAYPVPPRTGAGDPDGSGRRAPNSRRSV